MQMELPGCVFPEGIKEGGKPFFEDGGGGECFSIIKTARQRETAVAKLTCLFVYPLRQLDT